MVSSGYNHTAYLYEILKHNEKIKLYLNLKY